MATPSVTHTFTASTSAKSGEVNQNFTDVINALTDGTADLTVGTLSGTVTTTGGTLSHDQAVTINDSGNAVDFRVEGDTKTHLLFTDGSSDRVGINKDTPGARFHVELGVTNSGATPVSTSTLLIDGDSDDAPRLTLLAPNAGTSLIEFGDVADADAGRIEYSHSSTFMRFFTEGTEALRIDSGQQVLFGNGQDAESQVHIKTSDSTVTPNSTTSLFIEKDGVTGAALGIEMATAAGANDEMILRFTSSTSADSGYINYVPGGTTTMDINVAGTNTIHVEEGGTVMVGGALTPDTTLHVHKATAGSVNAHADAVLTVENSGDAFINILTPNTDTSGIYFGDPDDNNVGQLTFAHTSNTMSFSADGGSVFAMTINGTGVGITDVGSLAATTLLDIFQDSATAALPIIQLSQDDVDEPFIKMIGTAASADLTRSIVDTGDVTTATIRGYFKMEVQDDGNQVTDQDVFIPFYTLA